MYLCLQPESLHGILATGLSMEAQAVVQRMQLLGFNAVRLPFTFAELAKDPPRNYSWPCQQPTPEQVDSACKAESGLGGEYCSCRNPCSTGIVTEC